MYRFLELVGLRAGPDSVSFQQLSTANKALAAAVFAVVFVVIFYLSSLL